MKLSTKKSLATISQSFILGTLDAYTFNIFNSSFMSTQTGNLVHLGIDLSRHHNAAAGMRIPLIVGFLIGGVVAEGFKYIKLTADRLFTFELSFSTGYLLLLLTLFTYFPNEILMLSLLGFYASYELTLFNSIRGTAVNDGIMTGNFRQLANSLFDAIFRHDKKAINIVLNILVGAIIFLSGVLISAGMMKNIPLTVFSSAIIINLALLIIFKVTDLIVKK